MPAVAAVMVTTFVLLEIAAPPSCGPSAVLSPAMTCARVVPSVELTVYFHDTAAPVVESATVIVSVATNVPLRAIASTCFTLVLLAIMAEARPPTALEPVPTWATVTVYVSITAFTAVAVSKRTLSVAMVAPPSGEATAALTPAATLASVTPSVLLAVYVTVVFTLVVSTSTATVSVAT